jgi:ABC-type uncharacterized transport system fused permease/ATPase subunit
MQFLTASESKLVLKRLWTIVKPYWVSPQGKKAWMLLVGVLALLIGVSLVNVFINSVAGRLPPLCKPEMPARFGPCSGCTPVPWSLPRRLLSSTSFCAQSSH